MTATVLPPGRRTLIAAIVLLALLWPTTGLGQSSADNDTTTFPSASQAARAVVESGRLGSGVQSLSFEGITAMERLGDSSHWLVEVSVSAERGSVRLPMKLSDARRGWVVEWMPDPRYERALSQILDGRALPSADTADGVLDRWNAAVRIPSLPIILRDGRAVTPVGTARLSNGPRPPQALQELVGTWVNDVTERARGPASIDLLAAPSSTWNHLTSVAYAAAAAGLFRMYLIVEDGSGDFAALSTATPVSGSGRGLDPKSALILGMDEESVVGPEGIAHRSFRLSVAGELVEPDAPPAPCAASTALCLTSPDALGDALIQLLERTYASPPSVSHVMYAATGNVEIGQAIPYLAHVAPSLGIDRGRLFVGYIGETADFTESTRRPGERR